MSLRRSSSGKTARTGPAWLNIAIAIAMVATMFSALLGSASAQSAGSVAYLWANDPLAESYTPNEMYQYNNTGALNTVTRTGVGTYSVTLPGMATDGGHVQVTATSGSNESAPFAFGHVCEIADEPSGSTFLVQCVSTGGEPVDTGFSLLYTSGDVFLGWNSAYVWGNEKTLDSYTPHEDYQFNVTGQLNTIARESVGVYHVTLPGIGAEEGNVQVTSMLDVPVICTAGYWSIDEAGSKIVTVYCFDYAGAPADADFLLQHVSGVTDRSAEGAYEVWPRGAYLWSNHGEQASSYIPGVNFQFNTTGAQNSVEWRSTGTYMVTLPGLAEGSGTFMVTAYGNQYGLTVPLAHCQLAGWYLDETDNLYAEVRCYDSAGNPADSRFNLTYVRPEV